MEQEFLDTLARMQLQTKTLLRWTRVSKVLAVINLALVIYWIYAMVLWKC